MTWPESRLGTMFIRVKKIGPYECFYLVENAREGDRPKATATSSASSRRLAAVMPSRTLTCSMG